MRPVRVIAVYLLFVFVGGALLAPWVYELFQTNAVSLAGIEPLKEKSFPRFVSRTFLILAGIGLWPFLRASGMLSWEAIGLRARPDGARQVGSGFVLGLFSLAWIVILALSLGVRQMAQGADGMALLNQVFKAGLAALVVACLEELFFRGALFGSLRRTLPWPAALLLSSGIYALLHFLDRGALLPQIRWHSGFIVLANMLSGLWHWDKFMPGFLNLTLVGSILALAYQRTGSLHFSIGLHAGWIFWLKTYGFATDSVATQRAWLFGSSKMIDGWLAFLILAALLLALTCVMPRRDPPSLAGEPPLPI